MLIPRVESNFSINHKTFTFYNFDVPSDYFLVKCNKKQIASGVKEMKYRGLIIIV